MAGATPAAPPNPAQLVEKRSLAQYNKCKQQSVRIKPSTNYSGVSK
jgi:hypothetical protein